MSGWKRSRTDKVAPGRARFLEADKVSGWKKFRTSSENTRSRRAVLGTEILKPMRRANLRSNGISTRAKSRVRVKNSIRVRLCDKSKAQRWKEFRMAGKAPAHELPDKKEAKPMQTRLRGESDGAE